MLDIPEEVKALFSSDTVHKNFHVRFPNGECEDLNNENIASESVAFTESLCSQQYFKFGLAEASQLEFIAVGIPNVRGATIEAAIEIDCSRLGAEWAAENPGDDTLAFLTPQPCEYAGKPYYRVPYGRFVVDTCPRDHGAMWQRQITAYTETVGSKTLTAPYEAFKTGLFAAASLKGALKDGKNNFPEIYDPYLVKWVLSNLYWKQPERLIEMGYTRTMVGDLKEASYLAERQFLLYQYRFSPENHSGFTDEWWNEHAVADPSKNYYVTISAWVQFKKVRLVGDTMVLPGDVEDWNRLYEISTPGFEKDWALKQVLIRLEQENMFNFEALGFSSLEDLVKSGIDLPSMEEPAMITSVALRPPGWCAPFIRSTVPFGDMMEARYLETENSELIYPGGRYGQNTIEFFLPTKLICNGTLTSYNPIRETALFDHEVDITDALPEAKIYYLEEPEETPLSRVKLNFEKTLETTKAVEQQNQSVKKFKVYAYDNAFSALETFEGFLEICGLFLKPNRNGSIDFFQISRNPEAIEIPRSDWSEIWWDETPVDSIGQVKIISMDESETGEQQQTFTIGPGNSVYIMEDNAVLTSISADDATIQSILNDFFSPNAEVVRFTPADTELKGLPFLEAGDYLELTAEDGTTVETYVLNQTISGIQHLMMTTTSTNGELLEVNEDE